MPMMRGPTMRGEQYRTLPLKPSSACREYERLEMPVCPPDLLVLSLNETISCERKLPMSPIDLIEMSIESIERFATGERATLILRNPTSPHALPIPLGHDAERAISTALSGQSNPH